MNNGGNRRIQNFHRDIYKKKGYHLKGLCVGGSIILKWILKGLG
jgi:hypothetical protein